MTSIYVTIIASQMIDGNLDKVGQGPTALAVSAGGAVWTFLLSFILSLFFLPLSERRPNID